MKRGRVDGSIKMQPERQVKEKNDQEEEEGFKEN